MELFHHRQTELGSAERKPIAHEQQVKTQNLEMPNLARGDSPQELAEEAAQQVVGSFCKTDRDKIVIPD
jgi:hypothetical protein